MRDPERLENLYLTLKIVHKIGLPDWRFGQLCCNFFGWIYQAHGKDVFYMEDGDILIYFIDYISTILSQEIRSEIGQELETLYDSSGGFFLLSFDDDEESMYTITIEEEGELTDAETNTNTDSENGDRLDRH